MSATSRAGRARGAAYLGRRRLSAIERRQTIERAGDRTDGVGGDLGVERRGVELDVA